MSRTIAIVAPGEMGSAMGATLVAHGARVMTSAAGRSDASLTRARKAGFSVVATDDKLIAEADFLMSMVPPNAALELAERFAPTLRNAKRKPLYVDCNAVAPQTVKRVAATVEQTGCAFVDGALFGGPTSGKPGVTVYVSGPRANAVVELASLGLVVRVIESEVGAASAMKLSFAALNKGFTGVGVLALLGSLNSSSGPALIEQLSETQPGILAYLSRFVPAMFPKAYRWAPEMEEIAAFLEDDKEARDVFLALARLYRRLAKDMSPPAEQEYIRAIRIFCEVGRTRGIALPNNPSGISKR
jgi:hypothetical protein